MFIVNSAAERKRVLAKLAATPARPAYLKPTPIKEPPLPIPQLTVTHLVDPPRVARPPKPKLDPVPAPLIETAPAPRAFLNRDGQLRRLVDGCKQKEGHWLWQRGDLFSVDGKPLPVWEAAYLLYHGLQRLPEGYKPASRCRKHNCVAKECLELLPSGAVREQRRVKEADIHEVLRLKSLGKSNDEIAAILEKLAPRKVELISQGLIYNRA